MINKYRNNQPVPGVFCKWCNSPKNNRTPLEMIVKTRTIPRRDQPNNPYKSQFLGCPRWPECGYTAPITKEIQEILDAEPVPVEVAQDW